MPATMLPMNCISLSEPEGLPSLCRVHEGAPGNGGATRVGHGAFSPSRLPAVKTADLTDANTPAGFSRGTPQGEV